LRFYDRQEVKDIMAYLRLLVNPQDMISLRRIINVPRRGIGKTTWARLELFGLEHGVAGLNVVEAILETDSLGRSAGGKLRTFFALMQSLQAEVGLMDVADLTREVLNRTGYLVQLESESTADAQARIENLGEFVNAADDFDRRTDSAGLLTFLEQTALLTDQDSLTDHTGSIVLMTLHASKGLEFPIVFISGMENGLFPHSRSYDDSTQMEEERRLCYVGMTRAGTRLFLTSAMRRRVYGVEQSHSPSLFLADIPSACVVDFSSQPALAVARQPWNPAAHFEPRAQPRTPAVSRPTVNAANSTDTFATGSQVFHQHFGRGVIQKREGEGERLKLTVIFRDHGKKKVLANYAPMHPL
ncbi:MAG: 3'-5' exonuclease, partial [Candidatus Tectomicrobia bacterium]